ncbi:DUF2254 domain-containing protein [Amorphus coralli]|uniref:DUF2254 domain-containing protein n=1 Tax=Amorphus coralli TaxID=340680 RepID=UPI0003749F22|nr:DUF2254 domain-containing protein [Amorphus coralli]
MLTKWQWVLRQFTRKLWVRASLFAMMGVLAALISIVAAPFVPEDLAGTVGGKAVDAILNILASSMLAVTTFSLSVMVSHYGSVTSNVTPRATRLLLQDTTAQNALGTFMGSFLFSLVGIIALSTGLYGDNGRVILFAVTILVVLLIVLTMLRWIDHLSSLGRMEEPTEKVENATRDALRAWGEWPHYGARPLGAIPEGATPVFPGEIGYVQHFDLGSLNAAAESRGVEIHVTAPPGRFVHPREALAWVNGETDEDAKAAVRSAFSIGDVRTYDSDPRFGLSVLAEIASRALSPGINDPGTAIDIISRGVRVLAEWHEARPKGTDEREVSYPQVHVPGLDTDDLFEDVFTPIARDGASLVEVQIRLQKALAALADIGGPALAPSARRQSALALERSDRGLELEAERQRVRDVALAAG